MSDMENEKNEKELRENLRDFIGYVLTSARGLYREPQSYGPMRMVDTLEKALALLQELGIKDDSVEVVMTNIRENRWRAGTDAEGFAMALDQSIMQLVKITVDDKYIGDF